MNILFKGLVAAAVVVLVGAPTLAASKDKNVPEVFTAATANMIPDGLGLKIDVLRWSPGQEREAVLSVLRGASETELEDMPTVGYVWPDNSSVGYALKYTHRVQTADGGERLTLVTGRRLGTFSREPWEAAGVTDPMARDYTVLELRLDSNGKGAGTMSLATGVIFDQTESTISLENYDAATKLLDEVTREPTRYWARGS